MVNLNNNVKNLKKYIENIKDVNNICNDNKECILKKSKGQNITICKNYVVKESKNTFNNRIEKKNNSTIKIDNTTMNLLIQTIINKYVEKGKLDNKQVEHYKSLCKHNINSKKVSLISQKSNFKYSTLEDFIIFNGNMEIIKECLMQVFETLDKLYDDIQFHHCDPKCAQLFLFKNNITDEPICMLGDLDKVVFTLNINGKLYRIRVTKDYQKYTLKGIAITALNKIQYLNKITSMRYQKMPINSNLLEKVYFITSACILLDNLEKAEELRNKMLDMVLPPINQKVQYDKIIKLDKSIYRLKLNKRKSVLTVAKYVNYNYLYKYYKIYLKDADKLNSVICLKKSELSFCDD